MIGFIIFCASLFGIFTRFEASLAVIWPANALLIGLMARNPRWSTGMGWLMAAVGYVLADILTGSHLQTASLLAAANLMGAGVGFLLLSRFDPESLCLAQPSSVLRVLGVSIAGSFGAGVGGGLVAPLAFGSPIISSGIFWALAEIGNYLVILPVVLTAPNPLEILLDRRRRFLPRVGLLDLVPAVALVASCLLSALVGGAGALAIPVPALLWCAISYGLFTTSLLTLGFSVWTMIAISLGYIDTGVALSYEAGRAGLSARLGVVLITLAPLTVASVMAARTLLLEKLRYLASHDQLTGLLNRGAFRERVAKALAGLAFDKRPSALLMMDIDRFKAINDTFGHAAGDQILSGFAQKAAGCLRTGDAIGRVGGEEFCVLLPGCSRSEADATAERIRAAIAALPLSMGDGRSTPVTVSIGLAFTPTSAETLDVTMLRADQALYRAKQSGRDRVEAA